MGRRGKFANQRYTKRKNEKKAIWRMRERSGNNKKGKEKGIEGGAKQKKKKNDRSRKQDIHQ